MEINFDPKIFNPLYWHIKDAMSNPDIRIIFIYGGSSAAKSYSVAQAVTIDTLATQEKTMVMRKHSIDIDDSIYADFKTIGSRINKFTNNFQFIQKIIRIGTSMIRFRGLDKSERIKGISQFKRVFMDELTEFSEDDFKQIKKRLRGKPGQQIIGSWNPISRTHWIKKNVIDLEEWEDLPKDMPGIKNSTLSEHSFKKINKKGNMLLIKTTYLDNYWVVGHPAGAKYGFVDQHVIDNFEHDKLHDIVSYNVYALGEWGVITERLVFNNWMVVDEIPKHAKRIPSGVDWGFSTDPATLTDYYIDGSDLYLDEVVYERGLLNIKMPDTLQCSMQERLEEKKFKKSHMIIADSAEPKSIAEMRAAGFNIYAVKKPGIAESIKMLKSYNIKITRKSKNIIEEFENYMYKIDKDGIIVPEPIDAYNHVIDPSRYVICMKDRLW